MPKTFAAGDNYSIVIEGSCAVTKVWRRPSLSSVEGTRNAAEMTLHLERVVAEGNSVLLDLREAPPIAGPKTTETLGQLFGGIEKAGRRVAVLLGNDAIQLLQFGRVVSSHAPGLGLVTSDHEEALAWCAGSAPTCSRT